MAIDIEVSLSIPTPIFIAVAAVILGLLWEFRKILPGYWTSMAFYYGYYYHYSPTVSRLKNFTDGTIVEERVTLGEVDYVFFHLSNAVYAARCDPARFSHPARLCKNRVDLVRAGYYNAVGATAYMFVKELLWNQKYFIETHLVAYSEKWFVYTHTFRGPIKKDGTYVLYALAMSKLVYKRVDGKSIPPKEALEMWGFGPNLPSNFQCSLHFKKPEIQKLYNQLEAHEDKHPPTLSHFNDLFEYVLPGATLYNRKDTPKRV